MTESDGDEDPLAATLATVRERTTPDAAERDRLAAVADDLRARAREAIAALPAPASDADVLQVGSTARGTWLPGDRDVDLFVRFPTTLDREELERYGLEVGHAVLPEGREEFAEHPYVKGTYDGFDVDLVPCFDVADATAIRSAVDRTPFHTAYLAERLDESLAADVRVVKQFLTAIGAYGSDLRTRGFSGYLTELLVLEHGGARPLLEAADESWQPPVRFDPADHGTTTFDDPLVVVDPTDPERNVAAVCAAENVARLQHHARALLADPDPDRFEVPERSPLDADAVREHVRRRGTEPVALVVDVPAGGDGEPLVDDQLYPQLRRSLDGLAGTLEDHGFEVLRSTTFAAPASDEQGVGSDGGVGDGGGDDGDGSVETETKTEADTGSRPASATSRRAVLLFELAHAELPAVERHEGPPVHVPGHAAGFYEKYAETDAYGPFLDGDRYVVERERAVRDAAAFLREGAFGEVALGAGVERALDGEHTVYTGADLAALADTFGDELRRYFDPQV